MALRGDYLIRVREESQTVFLGRSDRPCKGQEIHAPGAVEFQESGRFIGRRARGQNIIQEEEGLTACFLRASQLEGAIDIDRTLLLAERGLAGDGVLFDQEGRFDRRCKPSFEPLREDLRLIEMPRDPFEPIDRDW